MRSTLRTATTPGSHYHYQQLPVASSGPGKALSFLLLPHQPLPLTAGTGSTAAQDRCAGWCSGQLYEHLDTQARTEALPSPSRVQQVLSGVTEMLREQLWNSCGGQNQPQVPASNFTDAFIHWGCGTKRVRMRLLKDDKAGKLHKEAAALECLAHLDTSGGREGKKDSKPKQRSCLGCSRDGLRTPLYQAPPTVSAQERPVPGPFTGSALPFGRNPARAALWSPARSSTFALHDGGSGWPAQQGL